MQGTSSKVAKTSNPTSTFINMALDMSWKLAIVVLVPIVGGYYLDQALETTPVMTIVGFFLAMGGMALVFWHTLQLANQMPVPKVDSKSKETK